MVLPYCITCFSVLVLVITNTKKWIATSTLPCQGLRCQELAPDRMVNGTRTRPYDNRIYISVGLT